jgi:hypothetical protein
MLEENVINDGTVATAPSKQKEIWQLRYINHDFL